MIRCLSVTLMIAALAVAPSADTQPDWQFGFEWNENWPWSPRWEDLAVVVFDLRQEL
jgi:hypothetical protein